MTTSPRPSTLVLAYAGASLPPLLLFVLSSQTLGTVANNEIIAVEIVRTLVGSIGLVAAVPITTWLAALIAPHEEPGRPRFSGLWRERPDGEPGSGPTRT